MFYRMYLSNICQRRQWPDPLYEPSHTSRGYFCKVRVNNREYSTDVAYRTEELARDGAAMKAFMICRNFSHSDGMYPGQRPGQQSSAGGVIQGLPVAIGTGRRNRGSASSYESTSSSDGTSSGDDSPKSPQDAAAFFHHQRPLAQRIPPPPVTAHPIAVARPHHPRSSTSAAAASAVDGYPCLCRRAPVHAYGRCAWCLRENGWA